MRIIKIDSIGQRRGYPTFEGKKNCACSIVERRLFRCGSEVEGNRELLYIKLQELLGERPSGKRVCLKEI